MVNLVDVYDEPFGDSSAIPTLLVSKYASEHVKVVLSADGGDEIFAGYDLYSTFNDNLKKIRRIPSFFSLPFSYTLSFLNLFIPSSNQGLKKKINVFSKILVM